MKRFDGTEIPAQDAERFRKFVRSHRWIFAKTYAAFCPHEYTLQREAAWPEFAEFFEFIWANGFDAHYGKLTQRYFIDTEDGWYYFVSANDVDENGKAQRSANIINRASLCQWELVEETDLFGTEYRWKRLPPEKRRNPYEDLPEN